ncbi:MAG TPA: DUF3047 domain-containing protein [Methylomirabilota bacterium]|nr:DUF3047 domain-containing protein [Methylomirabilota bacterium]
MVAPRPLTAGSLLGLLLVLSIACGPASAAECVVLDDFSRGRVGEFPPDWKARTDEGRAVYSIREEGGRRFLHAESRGLGIQAGREVAWDLEAYPILAWSWRPVEFPKRSDERKSGANDSPVSVYAVFPSSPVSVKTLKYIWSRVVGTGTHLTSSAGNTQVRVLRTGTEKISQWVEERVDVRESYRRYFKVDQAPKPVGIAVLTDSDDTKSSAQGDYANFRVCKP